MQVKVKKTVIISIEMTEDEASLIRDGIGNTSEAGRIEIGMSKRQSNQMYELYDALSEVLT